MIRPYHKPGKFFLKILEFVPDIFRSVDILGPSGGFEGTNQSAAAPTAAPSGGGGSFWDSEPAPAPGTRFIIDFLYNFNMKLVFFRNSFL